MLVESIAFSHLFSTLFPVFWLRFFFFHVSNKKFVKGQRFGKEHSKEALRFVFEGKLVQTNYFSVENISPSLLVLTKI